MAFWNRKKKEKEEVKENLSSIKEQVKGGEDRKMAEEDFGEFEDDFPEEAEAQPQRPQKGGRPPVKPGVVKPQQRASPAQPVTPRVEEDRYTAYHVAESAGVYDKQTKAQYDNLYIILAEIMSKLERIGRAVGY